VDVWYADLHGVLLQLLRFEVEVEGVVAVQECCGFVVDLLVDSK